MIVTVTPGKVLSATEAWTYAKFNQGFQPTFTITGTLNTSEIASGAVTAPKTTAGPFFFATSTFAAGDPCQYTLVWGTNTGPTALADGVIVCFAAAAANTGGVNGTQINVGVGGLKNLKKHNGELLESGDIRNGQRVACRYDSAAGEWEMISMLGNRPVEYLLATGTNILAITPSPAYALIADVVGRRFAVKCPNANTGAVTLNANALGALAIKKNKDQALDAGDIKAGQIIELILDDASPKVWQMQGQIGNPPASAGIEGRTRGLLIQPNSTNRLDFAADYILFRNTNSGVYKTVAAGSTVTLDPSVNGLNGIDIGAAAAGNWYYLWALYDDVTQLVQCCCSLSNTSTAPVVPGSYQYKARLGAFRITGTGPIVIATMYQKDTRVIIADTNIFNAKAVTAINTYQQLSGADVTALQTAIPPIARILFGTIGSATVASNAVVASDNNGTGAQTCICPAGTLLNNFTSGSPFQVVMPSGNNFSWQSSIATATNRLNVSGYEL